MERRMERAKMAGRGESQRLACWRLRKNNEFFWGQLRRKLYMSFVVSQAETFNYKTN